MAQILAPYEIRLRRRVERSAQGAGIDPTARRSKKEGTRPRQLALLRGQGGPFGPPIHPKAGWALRAEAAPKMSFYPTPPQGAEAIRGSAFRVKRWNPSARPSGKRRLSAGAGWGRTRRLAVDHGAPSFRGTTSVGEPDTSCSTTSRRRRYLWTRYAELPTTNVMPSRRINSAKPNTSMPSALHTSGILGRLELRVLLLASYVTTASPRTHATATTHGSARSLFLVVSTKRGYRRSTSLTAC